MGGGAALAGLAIAVTLAGCISPDLSRSEPAFEPLHLQGDHWVPFPPSAERAREEIRFPVNASGRTVHSEVSITETYAGVQVTGSKAEVTMRLYKANGDEVGAASRASLGPQNLHIQTRDLPVGEATLVIEVRGGSDGSGNGDHVTWTIDVT